MYKVRWMFLLILMLMVGCGPPQAKGPLGHLIKPLKPLPAGYGEPKVYSKVVTEKRYVEEVDRWEYQYKYDFFEDEWDWRWTHIYRPEEFHLTYQIIKQGEPAQKDITYSDSEEVSKEFYNSVKVGDELIPLEQGAETSNPYQIP